MPRMGRITLPNFMIWSTLLRTMSTGIANPTPLLAPLGEYIAVLMPAWQYRLVNQFAFLEALRAFLDTTAE